MIALDCDGNVLTYKFPAACAEKAIARGEAARTSNPAVVQLRASAVDRADGPGLTHRQQVVRRNKAGR